MKLNLKIKPMKRLAPRTAVKLAEPSQQNVCWSLDYMSDALSYGRRFRTVNILNDFNREVLGILVAHSFPSRQITVWLDKIAESCKKPDLI